MNNGKTIAVPPLGDSSEEGLSKVMRNRARAAQAAAYETLEFEKEPFQWSYHRVKSVKGSMVHIDSVYKDRSTSTVGGYYHVGEQFKVDRDCATRRYVQGDRLSAASFEEILGVSELLARKIFTRSY